MIILFAILLTLAIFTVMVIIVDGNRFVTISYTIESDKIDSEYNIVLLSDLHNKQYGKDNYKLLDAIKRLSPDFICCCGDMLTAHKGAKTDVPLNLFKYLQDYPVYYSIGNHEYRMKLYTEDYGSEYIEYLDKLRKLGVTVLENDIVKIDNSNICVRGIMIEREYYKRTGKITCDTQYIESLNTRVKDDNEYMIMLAHNPEYFEAYAGAGADLVLSGHVHGGIVKLPLFGGVISPRLQLFPKYDGGLFEIGDSKMILSRGLGAHTIPIRMFNPGELVSIKLQPCKND